jgi:CheY-like chemotaxis protein
MDVGKHPTVLIVEDDVVSRAALNMLLSASGYATRAVASAEEALRVARQEGSDGAGLVALVDVDLPGMSGLELLERLERERIDVPAVLVSATNRDSVGRWVERGVPHVQKPVDFRHLLSVISERVPMI